MQDGVGYPFVEPVREVSTGDDITNPTLPGYNPGKFTGGNIILNPNVSGYDKKNVRTLRIDLTNAFTDKLFDMPGTLIWFTGQRGGTSGPIKVRLDSFENDPFDLIYDRAISGIPFKKFYVTNEAGQAGIVIELVIVTDNPADRVGVSG